ncbi:MAG TPA: GAF domain-containing protein [Polyangiaceae bacterium]|jgi:GAF domain-containing protein|nr:GAF domain-containing protein [Polyangiaceae bacterium]
MDPKTTDDLNPPPSMGANPPRRLTRIVAGIISVSTAGATIYGLYSDKRIAVLAFIGMVFAIILLLVVARATHEVEAKASKFYDILVKVLVGFVVVYFMVLAAKLLPTVLAWLTSSPKTSDVAPVNPYLSRLKGSGDFASLLEQSLRETVGITRTDYNQIHLVVTTSDYSRGLVAVADAISPDKQSYDVVALGGIIGTVVATGRTINAGNIRDHPEYFPAVPETNSELAVPITLDGTVIGVINSEASDLDHYTNLEQKNLEQLGDALGTLLPLRGWTPQVRLAELPRIRRGTTTPTSGSSPPRSSAVAPSHVPRNSSPPVPSSAPATTGPQVINLAPVGVQQFGDHNSATVTMPSSP